jgi:hypothetical protein
MKWADIRRTTAMVQEELGDKTALSFIVNRLNDPGVTNTEAIRWMQELIFIQEANPEGWTDGKELTPLGSEE